MDLRAIAVVDDDHQVLESFQNLFASSGHNAEALSSAEHFLGSDALSHTLCTITDVEMS